MYYMQCANWQGLPTCSDECAACVGKQTMLWSNNQSEADGINEA